jgi:hypothetical protein
MRVLELQISDRGTADVHHDQARLAARDLVEFVGRVCRLRKATNVGHAVRGVVRASPAGVVALGLAQDRVVGAKELERDVDRCARRGAEEPAHAADSTDRRTPTFGSQRVGSYSTVIVPVIPSCSCPGTVQTIA